MHDPMPSDAQARASDRPVAGRLSVVVPVFNAEHSLRELVERIFAAPRAAGGSIEIILVNDGSRDQSWAVIEDLARSCQYVIGLDLTRNYGQHNALLAGLRHASGDVIVTLDDDLQHPPEEIPKLLSKLDDGYDVVYGTPIQSHQGLGRTVGSRLVRLALQQVLGAETARNISAFRAIRAEVCTAFDDYHSPTVSLDVLLSWGTTRFASVPVEHQARAFGQSNYSLWRLIVHALDMMVGFSIRPLRVASAVGFAFTVFGFGVLVYVLVNYIVRGGSVPGFTFIAAIVAIFSGIQLFSLGIIGEYLARIHLRLMERRPYIVRRSTDDG
jgi:undecaprenyl-phosphate 4-deoxy-4-formamido-L-arabinose transferase